MERFFFAENKSRHEYGRRFRRLDRATIKALKDLKELRDYRRKKFDGKIDLSFIESIIFYLTDGNPAEIKRMRKTKEKDILDYYYLNRVQDLNGLLDHIAYIKHLKEQEKKHNA